jgi:ketosteroid isomerase-like protein
MGKFMMLFVLAFALGPLWQEQDENPNAYRNPEILKREQEAAARAEVQREELVNLENEAARAIQLSNATFFRRVYSDDFTGTLSHGQPVNKTAFIQAVQSSEAKYEFFNASDITIRVYQDTAVATCLWSARGTFKGEHFSTGMRVIHVYVNGPRGWHVVAGQATILPPGVQLPI